jgi:hypothetical protein
MEIIGKIKAMASSMPISDQTNKLRKVSFLPYLYYFGIFLKLYRRSISSKARNLCEKMRY